MAPPKIFSGARAKVSIFNPRLGRSNVVGIWMNFDYNIEYSVEAAYILGRFTPAALQTVGVSPVSIEAGAWRVVDHDAFVDGGFTRLQDLLVQEGLTMGVEDRQPQGAGGQPRVIATIQGCYPTRKTMSVSERQLSRGTNSYIGLIEESTETTQQAEHPSATDLP